jgi:hypothetical protein
VYHEVIESHFDVYNPSVANRRHYRIDCPLCVNRIGKPDNDGHMHIFVDSWWCHCFRCGSHVPVLEVFAASGITDYPQKRLEDVASIVKKKVLAPEQVELKEPGEIELPPGCFLIEARPSLLLSRPHAEIKRWKIKLETAEALRWQWCPSRDAFVFPVFMNGVLVYWSQRGMDRSRSSPPGEFAHFGILYNFDCPLKDSVSDVYLVEGPKDSAVMFENGLWGLGLHGHALSPFQLIRINQLSHRKRMVLDADVFHSSQRFERSGIETLYLPSGDPADHGRALPAVLQQSTGLSAKVRQLIKNRQVS